MAAAALGLLAGAPQIVSAVADSVHMVERIFGKGKGQEKKAAAIKLSSDILGVYQQAAPVAGLTGQGTEDFNQALANLIEAIVQFYKVTGVFLSSQSPAAPALPPPNR